MSDLSAQREMYQDVIQKQDKHIDQLEQLCRDLWTCYSRGKCAYCDRYRTKYDQDLCNLSFQKRMDTLGLLEVYK